MAIAAIYTNSLLSHCRMFIYSLFFPPFGSLEKQIHARLLIHTPILLSDLPKVICILTVVIQKYGLIGKTFKSIIESIFAEMSSHSNNHSFLISEIPCLLISIWFWRTNQVSHGNLCYRSKSPGKCQSISIFQQEEKWNYCEFCTQPEQKSFKK